MRYDWSHAALAVTVLPLGTTHRRLHGLRCRPTSHPDHESHRPPAVTADGALYGEPATARRPLGRSSGRRKASRNGDTYHDIDPVGIFMQLTTALAAALTAQKSCCYSWRQGRWKALVTHWIIRQCAANTSGREKQEKPGLLNLGGVDIKICSLAWVDEAQHGTVAEEPLSRAASMFFFAGARQAERSARCMPTGI